MFLNFLCVDLPLLLCITRSISVHLYLYSITSLVYLLSLSWWMLNMLSMALIVISSSITQSFVQPLTSCFWCRHEVFSNTIVYILMLCLNTVGIQICLNPVLVVCSLLQIVLWGMSLFFWWVLIQIIWAISCFQFWMLLLVQFSHMHLVDCPLRRMRCLHFHWVPFDIFGI